MSPRKRILMSMIFLCVISATPTWAQSADCSKGLANSNPAQLNKRRILLDGASVAAAIVINSGVYAVAGIVPLWPPLLRPSTWTNPIRDRLVNVDRFFQFLRVISVLIGIDAVYENREWLEFYWKVYGGSGQAAQSSKLNPSERVNIQIEAWRKGYELKFGRSPDADLIKNQRLKFLNLLDPR